MDGLGYHNDVQFDDVDGDGRCDFMAAFEPWKITDIKGKDVNANDHLRSYVILNAGDGIFVRRRIELPNPYFGKDNAAISIGTITVDGQHFVALVSSHFPGPQTGFTRFKLQLFVLRNQEFLEVTDKILVGKMDNKASDGVIRFFDIDGDGDKDLYLTSYDHRIAVYLYQKGKFVLQRLDLRLPDGNKAVAFLRTPTSRCADMAVLDRNARLYRFRCLR
jgi:hypothetical protein